MNRIKLKKNAKSILKSNYNDSLLINIIYIGIVFMFVYLFRIIAPKLGVDKSIINIGQNIIAIIISSIMAFGCYAFYQKISRKEKTDLKELFLHQDLFIVAILYNILYRIIVAVGMILLFIPGIIFSYCYSQIYYIKLDNPDMKILDVFRTSRKLMKGKKLDFFVLKWSFLGWIVLGFFTLGLLYIWLIPYINITYANFYNDLIKSKK